ncbi:hypothetical protein PUR59_00410 [Streptomyces sp. SP18ES09]|uniref:hypothetical protein n=1 Tax=Streptomyces sp. SP18ES09 TaxID=3002532 RepID=UPI002E77F451|nr:hypothetical protein [Streptomyces sp. SP18ES09]MEE1813513.1 hypothetical protein [Streptomyces sp. SP18ES09]
MNLHEWITRQVEETEAEGRAILKDPAPVLRRCEADRRILERHSAAAPDRPDCSGCGSDDGWPVTDNINDCPELLDLAHTHGATSRILAGLDRPEHRCPPADIQAAAARVDALHRLRCATPARYAPATFRSASSR